MYRIFDIKYKVRKQKDVPPLIKGGEEGFAKKIILLHVIPALLGQPGAGTQFLILNSQFYEDHFSTRNARILSNAR